MTSNQRLRPPGEPYKKADDPAVWIIPGRGEYSAGDAFLHYRLMWEAYVASLAGEAPSKQMSPQLAGLVNRLQEWSRNCLIDGLKMDAGEPTLQATGAGRCGGRWALWLQAL